MRPPTGGDGGLVKSEKMWCALGAFEFRLRTGRKNPLIFPQNGLFGWKTYLPVEPKPPAPRWVSSSSSTISTAAWITGVIISWAMRSAGWMV